MIIMLIMEGEEIDELFGFGIGVDDFVTKPLKVRPLIQQIKSKRFCVGGQITQQQVDDETLRKVEFAVSADEIWVFRGCGSRD